MRRALSFFLLLPGAASAGATLPRPGDYLDTAYLAALDATHSPLAAASADSRAHVPQQITVQARGTGRQFAALFDWHSGALLFVLTRNGWIRRDIAWGNDPGFALRVISPSSFCITGARGGAHCYERVRDVAARVARATLAGTYADRQGAAYRFGTDGTAHFPGYDFTYAVVLEQSADRYDLFAINGERHMAFTRGPGGLTLYAVRPGRPGSYGTPDFAHPLAVLHNTAPPAAAR